MTSSGFGAPHWLRSSVVWASLTDEGRSTLECVGAEHTELLRSLFRGALDDDELGRLNELLGRLPGVGPASCV